MDAGVDKLSSVDDPDAEQIVQRLAGVEILYALSFQPMKLDGLIESARRTFGLAFGSGTLHEILANLEAEGLVAVLRKELQSDKDSSEDVYGITSVGLKLLKEYIESLSQMTLTMQLGFDQKLLRR